MPQLQTTCVKSLQDGSKLVRMRAAAALMRLAALSTRVEPLLNELHNQLLGAEPGVQVRVRVRVRVRVKVRVRVRVRARARVRVRVRVRVKVRVRVS